MTTKTTTRKQPCRTPAVKRPRHETPGGFDCCYEIGGTRSIGTHAVQSDKAWPTRLTADARQAVVDGFRHMGLIVRSIEKLRYRGRPYLRVAYNVGQRTYRRG